MIKKFAFTLIEMTMAICIIAIIAGAMSPIITKKLSNFINNLMKLQKNIITEQSFAADGIPEYSA